MTKSRSVRHGRRLSRCRRSIQVHSSDGLIWRAVKVSWMASLFVSVWLLQCSVPISVFVSTKIMWSPIVMYESFVLKHVYLHVSTDLWLIKLPVWPTFCFANYCLLFPYSTDHHIGPQSFTLWCVLNLLLMMSRNVVESQLPSVGIPFVLINQMPSLTPLWFDWMLQCSIKFECFWWFESTRRILNSDVLVRYLVSK